MYDQAPLKVGPMICLPLQQMFESQLPMKTEWTLSPQINSTTFYNEWSGHPLANLSSLHSQARLERPTWPIVFFAGDSSLDNKAWVPFDGIPGESTLTDVPSIYSHFLQPTTLKEDVAFAMNRVFDHKATVLNTAVEASTLKDREIDLLEHDKFIRDHIRAEDVLIVSVGANDIVLSPTLSTMLHTLRLAWLTPKRWIETGAASSLRYFDHLYRMQTQAYVARLVERQKPRAIIVCMIYYPLQATSNSQDSWAAVQLKLLGYNTWPRQLQATIRKVYERSTMNIRIEGITVIPCALFEALDGKNEDDYIARVEPSVSGGRKIAAVFQHLLDNVLVDDR